MLFFSFSTVLRFGNAIGVIKGLSDHTLKQLDL